MKERFWEQCIFKYLRAEPEDHYFLLVSLFNFSWDLVVMLANIIIGLFPD